MLDIKALRADPEQIAQALAIKGYVLDTKQFIEIEEKRKRLQSETETLQNERNVKSKSIGQAKAKGEDIEPLKAKGEQIKNDSAAADLALTEVQGQLDDLLQGLPNIPHSSVPAGKTEDDNIELRRWGTPRQFDFEIKDHVDLGDGFKDGVFLDDPSLLLSGVFSSTASSASSTTTDIVVLGF